jgi:hypothetical protein
MGELLDINGEFLHGDFEDGKNVFMEAPEGFNKYYDPLYYILLLQTIYGLKQLPLVFGWKLLHAFHSVNFELSKTDPCLYCYPWTKNGLTLWVLWIDDCFVLGEKKGIKKAKTAIVYIFDCDIIRNMDKYVGCKLSITTKNTGSSLLSRYHYRVFNKFNLVGTRNQTYYHQIQGSKFLCPVKKKMT